MTIIVINSQTQYTNKYQCVTGQTNKLCRPNFELINKIIKYSVH